MLDQPTISKPAAPSVSNRRAAPVCGGDRLSNGSSADEFPEVRLFLGHSSIISKDVVSVMIAKTILVRSSDVQGVAGWLRN